MGSKPMKSKNEITEIKNQIGSERDLYAFDFIGYLKDLSHKWAAIIVFLILWEILPTIGVVDQTLIPSLSTIAMVLWDPIIAGTLPKNTVISMVRMLLGWSIALIVAIPLGYLLGGFFEDFEKAVEPLLQLLGQLNPWSFFHLAIVFLGIGEISIVAAVFYISLWPVLYNTIIGVKNVNYVFVKIARAAGMEKFEIFWKVQLHASLPVVFAGMRLGALLAFLMVMGAEMMGASDGLGHMIMIDQMYGLIPQMWIGIVAMALLGIAFDYILLQFERYFTSWKEETIIL
ncbi:ABC transporter permease [Methanobacterium sp.]|uniref:ABC transporter permease n=1 Tax=Methanobacterium sp. TaxID=2164 RepID=UPI003C781B6B